MDSGTSQDPKCDLNQMIPGVLHVSASSIPEQSPDSSFALLSMPLYLHRRPWNTTPDWKHSTSEQKHWRNPMFSFERLVHSKSTIRAQLAHKLTIHCREPLSRV